MNNFLRKIKVAAFFAFLVFIPFAAFAVAGDVVINEIGWSGTKADDTDEWIELKNNTASAISLEGWILKAPSDGRPTIILSAGNSCKISFSGIISAGGFYLIERTADTVISDVPGDCVGSFGQYGNIVNKGEDLVLLDANGVSVDEARFASGWPAGTEKPDYFSMERIDPKQDGSLVSNWASNNGVVRNGTDAEGNLVNGTPKQENSVYLISSSEVSHPAGGETSVSVSSFLPSSPSHPIYPALGIDAGPDRTILVGSQVSFTGTALGVNNTPLLDARFVWNFGDGTIQESRAWEYIYYFPGTYTAALTVSSGPYSGFDTAIITALVPSLAVKNTQTGEDGFVVIANGSDTKLDLGGMILRDSAGMQFLIPKNTFVLPKGEITFANRVSGVLKSGGTAALYDAVGREVRAMQSTTDNKQPATLTLPISEPARAAIKVSPPAEGETLNDSGETKTVEDTAISQEIAAASQVFQYSALGFSPTSLFFGASVFIGLVSAAGFFLLKTFF
jgi:PKD repeat protein